MSSLKVWDPSEQHGIELYNMGINSALWKSTTWDPGPTPQNGIKLSIWD